MRFAMQCWHCSKAASIRAMASCSRYRPAALDGEHQAGSAAADMPDIDPSMSASMSAAAMPPLCRALPDLAAWTRWFVQAPMPVLADTAEAIEACRANEDAVDAHMLADFIGTRCSLCDSA
jgi:hypothetical protein